MTQANNTIQTAPVQVNVINESDFVANSVFQWNLSYEAVSGHARRHARRIVNNGANELTFV